MTSFTVLIRFCFALALSLLFVMLLYAVPADAGPKLPSTQSVSPTWIAESDLISNYFGQRVASAGDVNGDGFDDVAITTSPGFNAFFVRERVYVYHGSESGLESQPAWIAETEQSFTGFGSAVTSAGDANGDNFSDLIVFENKYHNGSDFESRIYLYYGSATGLSTTATWMVKENAYRDDIGAVAADDINRDGYNDIIIGTPGYNVSRGRIQVYYGSATGPDTTVDWVFECEQMGAQLGHVVVSGGDLNGDGYPDIVAGAPSYHIQKFNGEGRVYILYGSATGLDTASVQILNGVQTNESLGLGLASAGDVNGDSYDDLLCTHYISDGNTTRKQVALYYGTPQGINTTAVSEIRDSANAFSYMALAGAGDVNSDGFDDVLVGADFYSNGQYREGAVFLYYGSANGINSSNHFLMEGEQDTAGFGRSVARAGDVNGDDITDIIVGAPGFDNGEYNEGRAFVYSGNTLVTSVSPGSSTSPFAAKLHDIPLESGEPLRASITSEHTGTISCILTTILGDVVWKQDVFLANGTQTIELGRHGPIAAGFYLARFVNGDGIQIVVPFSVLK